MLPPSLGTEWRHSPLRGVVSALWSSSPEGDRTVVMVGSLCWSLFPHMDVLSQTTTVLVNKSLDLLARCCLPCRFSPHVSLRRQLRAVPGSGSGLLSGRQREACVLGRVFFTRAQRRETGIENPLACHESGLRASYDSIYLYFQAVGEGPRGPLWETSGCRRDASFLP